MRHLIIAVIIPLLAGCAMGHRDPIEAKETLNQAINNAQDRQLEHLPDFVEADLMPELAESPKAIVKQKRYRIQAKEVSAKTFFTSLVKDSIYSVAVHPDVTGTITLNLSEVTLNEVLDVVRDLYGYDIEKSGKVLQIYPAGLRTVSLPVDYLQIKRTGRSLTSISTGSVADAGSTNNNQNRANTNDNRRDRNSTTRGGTEIETRNESDFWAQLGQALQRLVGTDNGQSVVVSPQAGIVTLRAYPNEIREVRQFLNQLHERMQRQVVLEAKILEVTLTDGYNQGINWENMSFDGGKVLIERLGSSNLPATGAIGTLLSGQTNITISDGSFGSVLNFMATQGDINVLSSPRITASNNQKAVIKVGTDEYFVTDLSSTLGSGDNSSVAPSVELTPFFSGISLDVTPQIDDDGNVLLHVHPSVIEVEEQKKEINFIGNQPYVVPLARSSIRESDSVIRAQDGDVVVIGGLMKTSTSQRVSKVPLLGDVPLLGHLFRNTAQISEKTELVILLKPTVVGVNTWQKELERSRALLQEWFPDAE